MKKSITFVGFYTFNLKAKFIELQFQVFDLNDKNVSSRILVLTEGGNQFTYYGNHLDKGFYSYRLSNPHGFITGKMIVIK